MQRTVLAGFFLAILGSATAAEGLPAYEGVYARMNNGDLVELFGLGRNELITATLTPFARERYSTRCVAMGSRPPNIRLQALPVEYPQANWAPMDVAEISGFVVNARAGANNVSLAPIVGLSRYTHQSSLRLNTEANRQVRCVDWEYGVPVIEPMHNTADWGLFATKLSGVRTALPVVTGDVLYTSIPGISGALVVSDCTLDAAALRVQNIDQFNTNLQPGDLLLQQWQDKHFQDYQLGECGNAPFQDVPIEGYLLSVNGRSYPLIAE